MHLKSPVFFFVQAECSTNTVGTVCVTSIVVWHHHEHLHSCRYDYLNALRALASLLLLDRQDKIISFIIFYFPSFPLIFPQIFFNFFLFWPSRWAACPRGKALGTPLHTQMKKSLTTADVAVREYHQRQDKSDIFFYLHFILEILKVVCKKTVM